MNTDPIADMLTRIRNAIRTYRDGVDVPFSNLKEGIAQTLQREGYIDGYEVVEPGTTKAKLKLNLKYGPDGEDVILKIKSVSTPGRRVYKGFRELKPVIGGMGILVLSTSQGVMSDREAKKKKTGGEVLAEVF
ncbi:MAG: 30S ribosomal protein S8 [Planctomycetes bacterium]|nr:30S ribosomal protein S8 [Planctomycetota bacterium]